jgi:hypothetical protein
MSGMILSTIHAASQRIDGVDIEGLIQNHCTNLSMINELKRYSLCEKKREKRHVLPG